MNEQVQAPPRLTPLHVLRRRWWVAALCVPLCTALGAGFATTRPTVYTAETRLSVGNGDISTFAIPGFPLAARDLAANYARLVQNNYHDATYAPQGVLSIAASPIPESNVIRIEAQALSAEAATAAANGAAEKLQSHVKAAQTVNDPVKVKAQHEALAKKAAAAEAATIEADSALRAALGDKDSTAADVDTLREKLAAAKEKSAVAKLTADAQSDLYRRLVAQPINGAKLNTTAPAKVVKNNRSSLMQRFTLLGFGVGLALALAIAMLLERWRRRRPHTAEAHPPRARFLPGTSTPSDDLPVVTATSAESRSSRRPHAEHAQGDADARRSHTSTSS